MMKLLLIESIQKSESDILLAASATKGIVYGPEQQTILWFYNFYVGTDLL